MEVSLHLIVFISSVVTTYTVVKFILESIFGLVLNIRDDTGKMRRYILKNGELREL